jgi:mono/diheme cytochrome c family protein
MSFIVVLSAALSVTGCTQSGMQKKVGPPPAFISSTDEHFVARGRYLAENVAGCVSCHSKRDAEIFAGPVVSGTEGVGGQNWALADGNMGFLTAGNISAAGVGGWTDGELLHAMTAGVHRDGYALFPVMPYTIYGQMTESDAKAVVSYLRTLPSVEGPPSIRRLSVILTKVANQVAAPPAWSDPPPLGNILAKGEYLTRTAGCVSCHTPEKDHKPDPDRRFAGGKEFKMSMGTAIAPNITMSEGRGLGYWSEEDFLNKFRGYRSEAARTVEAGPSDPNTVMPWFDYAGMTDEDLTAIWVYLSAQPTHDNEVKATWRAH